jgi:hypothetical protein
VTASLRIAWFSSYNPFDFSYSKEQIAGAAALRLPDGDGRADSIRVGISVRDAHGRLHRGMAAGGGCHCECQDGFLRAVLHLQALHGESGLRIVVANSAAWGGMMLLSLQYAREAQSFINFLKQ